jgi:hypothetical protein
LLHAALKRRSSAVVPTPVVTVDSEDASSKNKSDHAYPWFAMGKFSPTTRNGDCDEIANPSTAYGRRQRNWIEAHGFVPARQVVDSSCGNKHCIALRHSYLRQRVEQPGKYPKIAKRVHKLKIRQHFDVPRIGTDERSRNRFRSGLYAALRLDKVSVRGSRTGV